MFTGIIEHQGTVKKKTATRLHVEATAGLIEQLTIGASIAVNGVCLTISKIPTETVFAFDVMSETLRRTTLGGLKLNAAVNLELPLRIGGHFGGHIVQGHADGTATITRIRRSGNSRVISFAAPEKILNHMVEQGSIAIDGVSLTLLKVSDTGFSIGIIPNTKDRTTLTHATVGLEVNVETDIVAKYVHKFINASLKKRHETR